ncbi:MAG: hypothetical protein Q4D56_08055 [Bacteroides sp.]|nr:hypothetical protein [Bacteroides sp.]
MDANVLTMETVNVQLPASDVKLLKELAKKMGWIAKKKPTDKTKRTELDLAIRDIKEGNVETFDSVEEVMNYLNS